MGLDEYAAGRIFIDPLIAVVISIIASLVWLRRTITATVGDTLVHGPIAIVVHVIASFFRNRTTFAAGIWWTLPVGAEALAYIATGTITREGPTEGLMDRMTCDVFVFKTTLWRHALATIQGI